MVALKPLTGHISATTCNWAFSQCTRT